MSKGGVTRSTPVSGTLSIVGRLKTRDDLCLVIQENSSSQSVGSVIKARSRQNLRTSGPGSRNWSADMDV